MRDMGTPPEWLVINDGKKIKLSDLSDLSNLEVQEAEKKDYALHKANVDYEPGADCPQFKEFVNNLLDGKENQIKTLQEFMGWLLKFPDRKFKKMLLILGVSNSGKSQLAELVELIFENESGKSVLNLSFPMMGAERPFHLNRLETAMLNIDKDLTGKEIQRADFIKKIAAQESLEVEPKGEDSFNITPEAKHIVCANVSPQIEMQDDDAFFNRFLTLKAPNAVPREERVRDLGKKLFEEEASGIFNWMLEGLKRLEENEEFTLMPNAAETQQMWMEFGDSVHRFLWQLCEFTGDVEEDKIPKDDLYDYYSDWVDTNMSVSEKATSYDFKRKVDEGSPVTASRVRINGVREQCFCGIKVDTSELYGLSGDDLEDDRPDEEREVE